jgi:iron complex outermembrane receptor protein
VERHPTATELYASGPHVAAFRYEIGDATLDTERGRTADLSLRLGRPDAAWRATVSVFASHYDRYVIAAPTDEVEDGFDVVRYTATDARFTGAEIEWSHERLAETAAGRLGARLFADSVRAEDDDGTPLPQIPPHRVGGALTLTGARLSLGLDAVWHAAQDRLAPAERPTGSFTLVGLDLAWRTPWANGNILWFVRGTNLLDEEARRHASPLKDYAPLAGRSVAAGIRMEF